MFVSSKEPPRAYKDRPELIRLVVVLGMLLAILLLFGCQSDLSANRSLGTSAPANGISPTTVLASTPTLPEKHSDNATSTPYAVATMNAHISKAWATSTRQAQLYPNLYPAQPSSFDFLKQYPGAEYLYEDPPWPDYPLKFEFETNEEVGAVEAYYNDLAKAQGWQPVTGMARQHYYYGDHGREHIYGYYLGFFAADGGNHLRTYVSVWIVRSLPVYRGATDVIEGSSRGVDDLDFSVEFLTEAQPATVLAFYKELLPEIGWNFQPEESSRMRLFWKTGKRTSHAEVFAQPQPSGKTRVKVKTYYGCCGG